MSPFWIAVLSFLAGTAVGVFIALNLRSGKDAAALKERLERLQQEFDEYRTAVGRHFVETSTLVNNLTQSYREVHQHLSGGAQTLCSEDLALELQRTTVPLIRDTIEGDARAEAAPRAHPAPAPMAAALEPVPGAGVADAAETMAPEPHSEPHPPDDAGGAEDLEEIVRRAQGASGRGEEQENLADIARRAEGAYADGMPQEVSTPAPGEIPDEEVQGVGGDGRNAS
ncbi:MAG: DUF1043 family protein [gamma proteobacterium symbiont of Phacoides pectinatus]